MAERDKYIKSVVAGIIVLLVIAIYRTVFKSSSEEVRAITSIGKSTLFVFLCWYDARKRDEKESHQEKVFRWLFIIVTVASCIDTIEVIGKLIM